MVKKEVAEAVASPKKEFKPKSKPIGKRSKSAQMQVMIDKAADSFTVGRRKTRSQGKPVLRKPSMRKKNTTD